MDLSKHKDAQLHTWSGMRLLIIVNRSWSLSKGTKIEMKGSRRSSLRLVTSKEVGIGTISQLLRN